MLQKSKNTTPLKKVKKAKLIFTVEMSEFQTTNRSIVRRFVGMARTLTGWMNLGFVSSLTLDIDAGFAPLDHVDEFEMLPEDLLDGGI